MSGLRRAAADLCLALASRALPPRLGLWGEAMRREAGHMDDAAALAFAAGCLCGAVRAGATARLDTLFQALRHPAAPAPQDTPMPSALHHLRTLAILCGVAATGLGFVYLSLAGASSGHLLINACALALGLLAAALAARTPDVGPGTRALCVLGAGLGLLVVALLGSAAEGATRWLVLGGVTTQPSLILLPTLTVLFARTRTPFAAAGVAIAALALALQPDRAMAAALMAGLAAVAVVHRERTVLIALAAATAATAVAAVRPDRLGATPFVDQVFHTAFATHPLAGLAVWTGAALLLVPGLVGLALDPAGRARHAAFVGVWFTVLAAAWLGNYPTPLVAYGGSAIVGYLLSAALLPRRAEAVASPTRASAADADGPAPMLRAAA